MLTDFTVVVRHGSTVCKLRVNLLQREADYVVTYQDRIIQTGSLPQLVPGATVDDVSVPDRAIEFLNKRIKGMDLSCQLMDRLEDQRDR